ncbi:MAG TPA: acyl-ACP--UDP-N-acetylglucosamine O-acyltransferase [Burkholderiales bacterium]|jgi:UDP-N-acetylglucosamine acyltransferase|nr:acyl-ACP--UDP-N-acetylglucosamine O-acyltransferase [Burkholderiales bacterium]
MIHPTAIVHEDAKLAPDVEVGPFSIIGAHVEIGTGTSIGAHTVIAGHTRIGANNRIFHHVVLGEIPQDKKYAGEATTLEIGTGNTIREFCTFHIGTMQDAGLTRLGDDNWIMAYVHLAHDCVVGSHTILANCAQLAGHVHIGDYAIVGGMTGVHQFCRIGAHAMTGASTVVLADVPPYVTAMGNTAEPRGINSEGLRRRGFSAEVINNIRRAYKTLYKSGLALDEAKRALHEQAAACGELAILVDFLDASKRSIIR